MTLSNGSLAGLAVCLLSQQFEVWAVDVAGTTSPTPTVEIWQGTRDAVLQVFRSTQYSWKEEQRPSSANSSR